MQYLILKKGLGLRNKENRKENFPQTGTMYFIIYLKHFKDLDELQASSKLNSVGLKRIPDCR